MHKADIAVIILANHEEANIGHCLGHVLGWAKQVFVLDSGSTDRTMDIARSMGASVFEHPFPGYAVQRNWALDHLPLESEWVFYIDSDEYPTEELKEEITEVLSDTSKVSSFNGFYIKRRFIFEGAWIRHGGYYPVWLLRLFRRRVGRWDESVKMDEHALVEGKVGRLEHDLMHEDRRGLDIWKKKHREYAGLKADEYWERKRTGYQSVESASISAGGDAEHAKRITKQSAYDRLPLFLRPFLYFGYAFIVRGGFLDGPRGWKYHVLRNFWYPWLIDKNIRARMNTDKN